MCIRDRASPALLYTPQFAERITVGNFDDDLPKIKNTDWIIEVVVERLDIKKAVYEKIEQFRKPGTLVSSNTVSYTHLDVYKRQRLFRYCSFTPIIKV